MWLWIAGHLLGTGLLRWQVDLVAATETPGLQAGGLATGLALLGAWFVAGLWWFQRQPDKHLGTRAPEEQGLSRSWGLVALVLVGLALRLLWFGSAPLFEDDAWRYLWDGALTANGHSPYVLPPQTVKIAPAFATARDPILAGQRALVEANPEALAVLYKINHPWLATLYPPVAQGLFALAHWFAPFSMAGLQILLLVWELLTLASFALLLRVWGQPLYWLIGYWWNPLLIEEVANSLHMDVLLLPFLALALLALRWARPHLSALALALAAGIKIWPLVLVPVLAAWRPRLTWRQNLRRALSLGLVASLAAGLIFWPMIVGVLQGNHAQSGLVAYVQRWEMNDSLFMAAKGFWHQVAGLEIAQAERLTRGLVALLVIGLALWFYARGLWHDRAPGAPTQANESASDNDHQAVAQAFLWVAALLFLTSPTQFPWYYLWLFPALLLRPVWPFFALTAALPLYYWRFQAQAQGWTPWFDQGLVWLEFGPILAWLAWLGWPGLVGLAGRSAFDRC